MDGLSNGLLQLAYCAEAKVMGQTRIDLHALACKNTTGKGLSVLGRARDMHPETKSAARRAMHDALSETLELKPWVSEVDVYMYDYECNTTTYVSD